MTTDIKELRRRLDAIVQSDHHPYDVQLAIEALGIVEQLSTQTAEPVAYIGIAPNGDRCAFLCGEEDTHIYHMRDVGYELQPLYTHPAKTEQPSLSDEREEDEYVIDRLSTILAGVSIALKGEELPLHRHSYHDLAEFAKAKMLEIDLLNHQIAELSAAQRQDSDKEPLVWESITPCYTRFISEARYQKFSPEVRAWYRPVCEKCAAIANGAPK